MEKVLYLREHELRVLVLRELVRTGHLDPDDQLAPEDLIVEFVKSPGVEATVLVRGRALQLDDKPSRRDTLTEIPRQATEADTAADILGGEGGAMDRSEALSQGTSEGTRRAARKRRK